jgi:2-polyprenyl-3-methyl-5-hydroxy-6-metoxy-1,4-benzoquinol methylase
MMETRRPRPELMDNPSAEPAELERGLADLRLVNRWLGGTRLMLRLLEPIISGIDDRPVRVLDVATGSGDIPMALDRWARRRGVDMRITATDIHPVTVAAARAHTSSAESVDVVQADALDLSFGDGEFHVAICAAALHHFGDGVARGVLREMARVSSRGVVVTDLHRSRLMMLGADLLAATVWRGNPVTRHDGPVSVRAAFSLAEMRALARDAGMDGARVSLHAPIFRVSLVADVSPELCDGSESFGAIS